MIQGAAFRILACFYNTDTRSFVEICESAGYPTDLGGYYIRQLVRGGYLEKINRGQYALLPKGKQELAFNYGKRMFAPRPRLMVLLVARRGPQLVLTRRTTQPFIGTAEWPAGAVGAGEKMQEAAVRMLRERVGCAGTPQLVGFFRRVDLYGDTLFDDKLFAVHVVDIQESTTINEQSQTGQIIMCGEADLPNIAKPAKSLLDIYHYSQSSTVGLEEHTYSLVAADLSI